MSSTLNLLEKVLASRNQLQTWLSTPRGNGNIYASIYNREHEIENFPAYSFNQGYDVTKSPTAASDVYSYDVPTTHIIGSIFCTLQLPEIRVLEEYEDELSISWKPKTGILIIQTAAFVRNGENVEQTLVPQEVNTWFEYYAERLLFDSHDSILGDIQGSTHYSTCHKAKTLLIPQPFFFTFPLYGGFKEIFNQQNKYTLRYKFETDYFNLIRGIRSDGTPVEKEELEKKCRISFSFRPPKITFRLRAVRPEEHKELWSSGDVVVSPLPNAPLEKKKKVYVEPFQQLVFREPREGILRGYGSISIALNIKECVRGLFFYIENIDDFNNPFRPNYLVKGEIQCPIVSVTLKFFDNDYVYQDEDPIHFLSRHPKLAQLRTPKEHGYFYISFSDCGILSRFGTDSSIDPSLVEADLTIKYEIPKDHCGKLHIIYDVFRMIVYQEDKYEIYRNTIPSA